MVQKQQACHVLTDALNIRYKETLVPAQRAFTINTTSVRKREKETGRVEDLLPVLNPVLNPAEAA